MDNLVIGTTIRNLRIKNKMTQKELANKICVSDKTISKWETGKGLPDINFLEPLANAIEISLVELLSSNPIANHNTSSNINKANFYVCNKCGNIIFSIGNTFMSCCGNTLSPKDSDLQNNKYKINYQITGNEIFVSINHEMNKKHFVSFIAYVANDRCEIVKLYPEQNAEARFLYECKGTIYFYCNKHGLIKQKL